MTKIYLIVKDGCMPCARAKAELAKVDGWEKVVNLIDVTEDQEMIAFAKKCGVRMTPTLVALTDDEVVAMIEGPRELTEDFWRDTVEKHAK